MSELVDWCGVNERPRLRKAEQVIVGDHGLAVSSDLDLGPERCRLQCKIGHQLFVVILFCPRWLHSDSCMASGPVRSLSHKLFSAGYYFVCLINCLVNKMLK